MQGKKKSKFSSLKSLAKWYTGNKSVPYDRASYPAPRASSSRTRLGQSLYSLPFEILELIIAQVRAQDLYSLRLVCRGLNQQVFPHFGRKCFGTIRSHLSWDGLQRLKLIANHDQLRHYVELLSVVDDPEDGFWRKRHPGPSAGPSTGTAILRDMLSNSLINCRSFRITRRADDWDYNNNSLRRFPSSSMDGVAIIVTLIVEMGLPVKLFEIRCNRSGDRGQPLFFGANTRLLLLEPRRNPNLKIAWDSLETLELEHKISADTFEFTVQLILCAQNLLHLKLHLSYGSSGGVLERLSSAEHLPPLRSLRLSSLFATEYCLSVIIRRCGQTLTTLSLKGVYISTGSWIGTFGQIKQHLPNLEDVCVAYVRDVNGGSDRRVAFPGLLGDWKRWREEGKKLSFAKFVEGGNIMGANYEGLGAADVLGILEDRAVRIV